MPRLNTHKNVNSGDEGYEWIKERLSSLGKKVKDLADATGQPPSRISEKIKGKTDFQADEIPAIAKVLEMPVSVVLEQIPCSGSKVLPQDSMLVEVHGAAQAGKWNQTVQWKQKDWQYILVPKDTEYPYVYALRVVGDDMDKSYPPEKSVALYVPYEQYRKNIGEGDHVIVQRSDGNGQYEVSIKEIQITGDSRLWLNPQSSNPIYRPIELVRTDGKADYYGSEDLKITGVVIGAVIDHKAPKAPQERRLLPAALG